MFVFPTKPLKSKATNMYIKYSILYIVEGILKVHDMHM